MEKFTKGEWKAFGMEIRYPDEISGEYISPIASVSRVNKSEYDAALIAAAPEMYAKLNEISDGLLEAGGFGNCALAREIESLLSKARGEK